MVGRATTAYTGNMHRLKKACLYTLFSATALLACEADDGLRLPRRESPAADLGEYALLIRIAHITDKAAVATDWNVAADTHPTLYIHSNTDPITDYMTFGAHDGTSGRITVVGGTQLIFSVDGSEKVKVVSTTFAPA